jgi:hypothetical protein
MALSGGTSRSSRMPFLHISAQIVTKAAASRAFHACIFYIDSTLADAKAKRVMMDGPKGIV